MVSPRLECEDAVDRVIADPANVDAAFRPGRILVCKSRSALVTQVRGCVIVSLTLTSFNVVPARRTIHADMKREHGSITSCGRDTAHEARRMPIEVTDQIGPAALWGSPSREETRAHVRSLRWTTRPRTFSSSRGAPSAGRW